MTLPELLKRYQELYGVQDSALARALGVSPATICRLKNGTRQPSVKMLHRIAKHTKINIAQLVDASVEKDTTHRS